MAEKREKINPNPWDRDYYIRAYDHIKGEFRKFKVEELPEDVFRKWLCHRLGLAGTKEDFKLCMRCGEKEATVGGYCSDCNTLAYEERLAIRRDNS